jgi:hypothetical protein
MSSTRANSSSQSRSGTVWSSEAAAAPPSLAEVGTVVETASERPCELDCSGVKELDKLLRESKLYCAGVVVQELSVELVPEEEKLPKNGMKFYKQCSN